MMRSIRIIILPVIFFIISLLTVYDYGVNWDSLQHFVRGHMYLRFLTTGKKDFSDLPDICRNQIGNGSSVDYQSGRICDRHHMPRTSFYEKTSLDFAWTEKMTIGHPPLGDILLAFSNKLLFKTLGWAEDIQAYHVGIISATFLMACIVAVWSYRTSGIFAGFISVLALYTYPLLFAEQHFNPKDPMVAAFFTGFLYFFWDGIEGKKYWSLYLSGLFAGLSLGTKFNILFVIPIIGIWMVFLIFREHRNSGCSSFCRCLKKMITFPMTFPLIGIPIIAFALFYFFYPALWGDPLKKIISVIQYYKDVGGSRCLYYPFTGRWYMECTDFHTIRLYTTTLPIVTLLLSSVGLIYALKNLKRNVLTYFLWVIWLVVPIGRAMVPLTTLYGGSLRQIMEFIPAVSLLSGLGAVSVRNWVTNRRKTIVSYGIILCYIPVIIAMIKLHPNENLYYNILVGGLKGAVSKHFPLATNTFGNGYKQAIDWINFQAPIGASVYLAQGITSAVPSIFFRPDLHYKGTASDIEKHDEAYYLELYEPGMDIHAYHTIRYLHTFFKPVYEIKVEGVPIAAVWVNDAKYIKKISSLDSEIALPYNKIIRISDDEIILDIGDSFLVKKITIHSSISVCFPVIDRLLVFISGDQSSYMRLMEKSYTLPSVAGLGGIHTVSIPIGVKTRYIRLYSEIESDCDLSTSYIQAYSF